MPHLVSSGPIVVVDDDPSSIQVMAAMLRLSGHPSISIPSRERDGASLMQQLLDLNPALIFLDLTLGQADGRDVARQLREAGSLSYLVACSGWGGADEIRGTLAAGFDEHWVKPLDWTRMRAWLDAHVPAQ
jgi:CheY-like chemotaxis protein